MTNSLVKTRRTFGRIRKQVSKIRDAVEGFHLLENSHKLCLGENSDKYFMQTVNHS